MMSMMIFVFVKLSETNFMPFLGFLYQVKVRGTYKTAPAIFEWNKISSRINIEIVQASLSSPYYIKSTRKSFLFETVSNCITRVRYFDFEWQTQLEGAS